MLGEFWKSVAGKLADRWAGMAAPAVVFWAGGLLAWAHAEGGWSQLADITDWLNNQTVVAQLAAIVGALVIVAASMILVQRLTTPVLRVLEGYWPRRLSLLADARRQRALNNKTSDDQRWQALMSEIEGVSDPCPSQRAELARLERRRRRRPIKPNELLPTRIGNILRAVETRPLHRYGLDMVVIWPRLWLVLPDSARNELTSARASLDASVAAAIWGTAFLGFTWFTWWALLALLVPVAAVGWWVPARAEVFSELVEAATELYRVAIYKQLRWPLPENPQTEYGEGQALTKYLERGSDSPDPAFTREPENE